MNSIAVYFVLCIIPAVQTVFIAVKVVANSVMSGGGEDGTLMEVQEGSKQTKFEDLPLAEVVH